MCTYYFFVLPLFFILVSLVGLMKSNFVGERTCLGSCDDFFSFVNSGDCFQFLSRF